MRVTNIPSMLGSSQAGYFTPCSPKTNYVTGAHSLEVYAGVWFCFVLFFCQYWVLNLGITHAKSEFSI